MQDIVRLFVKVCSEHIPTDGPVYEFGSLQVPGQEEIANLRPFFPGKEYVGCDMRPGNGVDRIENVESGLSIQDGRAGLVLCLETLEHVFDVFTAIRELKRVLRHQNGVLILSSVMDHKIHGYPHDYWRFTPICFLRLLSDLDVSLVGSLGNRRFPRSVFGVGVRTGGHQTRWAETLEGFSGRFADELARLHRYDRSWWRRVKLAVYRAGWHKRYERKVEQSQITWMLHEKGKGVRELAVGSTAPSG
jgi:SAM-dependent methyltransferase